MNYTFDEIITAPATIPGSGAITVIRISGQGCLAVVDKVVEFKHGDASTATPNTIKFGTISSEGEIVDEVLVSIFKAPHSYTGEDSAEISCHASRYIASEILRLLCNAGARMAEPGEFTRRAFVNGKMDLAQAEAVADVISSTNAASQRVAMKQLKGGYSEEFRALRDKLLEMSSLLELELDFSEEEVEFADRTRLSALLQTVLGKVRNLTDSFRYGNAIRNGIPVAIVGSVNAGKSTLLNSLLGDERAIVSDVAGTTRDTVEETMTIEGRLFRFIDTAGLRETEDVVEKIGITRSYLKLSEASAVLALVDPLSAEEDCTNSISDIASKMDFSSQKLIVLLNKTDLLAANKIVNIHNRIVSLVGNKAVVLNISAKKPDELFELKKSLLSCADMLSLNSDQIIVTNYRHYSALCQAAEALENLQTSLSNKIPNDLLAEDLRLANRYLGSIIGEVSDDEILGNIFKNFCIGK